eukprot:13364526-Alexandrium_andersonii.AAC.1
MASARPHSIRKVATIEVARPARFCPGRSAAEDSPATASTPVRVVKSSLVKNFGKVTSKWTTG